MRKRIGIIDEVKGLMIIIVVIYHSMYNLAKVYKVAWFRENFASLRAVQVISAVTFVLISGVCFELSRSNLKRGIKLGIAALSISAALWLFMREQMIWFGIIHFLALIHIVLTPLKKYLEKIPLIPGLAVCTALFLLTYNLRWGYLGFEGAFTLRLPRELFSNNFLLPLGFKTESLVSADFYPFFPWAFCFIAGILLGRYAERLPHSLKRIHIRPLAFIGRHTLIIYIAHQPVIYGIMRLILR